MEAVAISGIVLASLAALYIISRLVYVFFGSCCNSFEPKGKHCYVTGGSSGLGFAIAKLLVQQGAHVTIVARRINVLEEAVGELESCRMFENQKIQMVSADLTDPKKAADALLESEAKQQTPVDYVFACAGASKPGFFHEAPISDYTSGMTLNYLGSVYTAKAAVNSWLRHKTRGKLILTASTLGLTSFVGYSQYSPTKFALRSFAECLRQEFLMLGGLDVHIYYVSTINSPGLEKEDKTKPKITKDIEGTETSDCSPMARAKILFVGLRKNQFAITSDLITDLLRIVSIANIPSNSLFDFVLLPFGIIFSLFFRWIIYSKVIQERKMKQ